GQGEIELDHTIALALVRESTLEQRHELRPLGFGLEYFAQPHEGSRVGWVEREHAIVRGPSTFVIAKMLLGDHSRAEVPIELMLSVVTTSSEGLGSSKRVRKGLRP